MDAGYILPCFDCPDWRMVGNKHRSVPTNAEGPGRSLLILTHCSNALLAHSPFLSAFILNCVLDSQMSSFPHPSDPERSILLLPVIQRLKVLIGLLIFQCCRVLRLTHPFFSLACWLSSSARSHLIFLMGFPCVLVP